MRPAIEQEGRAAEFRSLFEDERRFRAWYEAALPTVYGYVFVRCGGVRHLAEELTQEAFVEAIRSRDRFDGRSEPVTWVCAIAKHRLVDHFRRQHRDERRRLRLLMGGEERTVTHAGPEERDAVLRMLREIPPLERAALVLHYFDDLPVNEIATLLDRSESAVESLLARGRKRFRRLSFAEGGES